MVDYTSYSDEQLVKLCKDNCEEAWGVLSSRYITVARAVSFKFKGYGIEAEDLVQEGLFGFLSAVQSFNSNISTGFKTYANSCIHNRVINAVKAAKAKRQIPADLRQSLDDDCSIADTLMSPEEIVVSKDSAKIISEAVHETLSEKETDVFKMYLSGESYESIAKKLSMTPKAVDGALQRARRKLRSII
ncbi:MAG: sigma-70 family RNA polymerase sigma factor [Ruminococcus sp.]|nr:sigma-70 family RNA polymerase sigma factor [Ruminococcus sp.]